VAREATVEKIAGGFHNICGGAVGPDGDIYFVDAHEQRIYRWNSSARKLITLSPIPPEPINLVVDQSGNLLVVSGADDGAVYAVSPGGSVVRLKPEAVSNRTGKRLYLPVGDWRLNRNSLSTPVAQFISPDGTAIVPAGEDFLRGSTSWGVKSSPQIRAFGLGRALPGEPFYVSEEAELRTWVAEVSPEGGLEGFRLFAEQGGEGVTVDSRGHVYLAAGQIYVYDARGKRIDTIGVPERPVQLLFGGSDRRTLFICARAWLYSVRMKYAGR
jgi:hypothetical protein